MQVTYQTTSRTDSRKLAELLCKEGQRLLPKVELRYSGPRRSKRWMVCCFRSLHSSLNGQAQMVFRWTLCCLTLGVLSQELHAEEPAQLVFINARIMTVDDNRPEAEAVAIRGEQIVAVGAQEEVQPWITRSTRVVDARGRLIVPGFNDAHIHPRPIYPVMSRLGTVPCGPDHVSSLDQLIATLKKKASVTPAGDWIIGSGYQDTKLGRHPTHQDLDRASTEHPIYLGHSSGHVAAVNSLALKLARVDRNTPNPRGGAFDRDPSGHPNGVCRETAKRIVLDAGPERPRATTQEQTEGLARCFADYVRQGITSIQIAGTTPETVDLLRLMDIKSRPVRIYVMLRSDSLDELRRMDHTTRSGNNWLRLGAVKHWFGNSLSGRTCWLYEPYADRPDYFGIPPKDSQAELDRLVMEIHQAGLQACIHANGDREIDMLLDAYERAIRANPRQNHRQRIEHCSVVNEKILQRIKQLNVVLATHSYVYEHGDKMEAYGEQRWNMMHPNRSAMEMGIPVAGTSDAPVSKAMPLLRIQSMVTRQSAEGKVYGAKQKVTVEQAIRAWTLGSAYASFEEDIKGSITVGKLADLALLSQDPRRVPPLEIGSIEVDMTVVGGRVGYDRNGTKQQ